MDAKLSGTGIDPAALERYVREQIYSLPGTDRHRDVFTVLLTGSRACGDHAPASDVDIDVLCPQPVWQAVHAGCLEAGIVRSRASFFLPCRDERWREYFGADAGRPHFSLTPLETVARQVAEYDDVALWIWTHARILADPAGRFGRIVAGFRGYPGPVLVRKIKYRWLLAAFWGIDVYPLHPAGGDDHLPAAAGVLNSVQEYLRLFFLAEGRPFPYAEKLMRHARQTALGREFCPLLARAAALVVGSDGAGPGPWQRLERACGLVVPGDGGEARRLEGACMRAMIEAGVDPEWVRADYDNINELLSGDLGPVP